MHAQSSRTPLTSTHTSGDNEDSVSAGGVAVLLFKAVVVVDDKPMVEGANADACSTTARTMSEKQSFMMCVCGCRYRNDETLLLLL